MGRFIDIKFLPVPRNDGGGQASGQKLKSMASTAQDEKPGYEAVFSGRPLEMQEVVEILDVWDKESSWRSKEESPEQEQVRKLLDGLCEGAGINLFSLAAFKNQFQMDSDFSPASDEGVMRMALFLVPLGSDEASFVRSVIGVLGPAAFSTGWGRKTSEHDGKPWRVLLVLSKLDSVAQSESAMAQVESSLNGVLEPARARILLHHIRWKNPLAQAGLAVSGGMNQSAGHSANFSAKFSMMLHGFDLGLRPSPMVIFLGTVALLIIHRIATIAYRLWFHSLSKFPGPSYLAISNIPFRYRSHIQGLFFKTVAQLHLEYGPIVRISPDSLSIDGQYAWDSIYIHKSTGAPEWPKVPGHFFPGDHNVLINAPRETHRRQRRAIAPAFSTAAINAIEPDIARHVDTLLRALDLARSEGCVDIMRWFYLLTMDIVSDLIFSDSFNSLENNTQQKFMLGFFDSTQGLQIGSFLLAFPLLVPLLPLAYMADIGGLKTSRKYGLFIEAKAKARMSLGLQPGYRRDFITYIMQHRGFDEGDLGKETTHITKKGMSDLEISQNSLILATAGSDSTTTTMCGVLYHLAQPASSKARAAVLDEVRSTFTSEGEICLQRTTPASLPYLNACIEETMRIYPSTAEQPPRVSPGEVVGDVFVPQGTKVYTYQWSTNRNPKHFANAQEYHPERFLPKSHSLYDTRFQHDDLSLVKPFSHGPRDCVGRNLAYAILRLTLTHFLYRFDYQLTRPGDDWIAKQTVKFSWTKGPLSIKLVPRDSRI